MRLLQSIPGTELKITFPPSFDGFFANSDTFSSPFGLVSLDDVRVRAVCGAFMNEVNNLDIIYEKPYQRTFMASINQTKEARARACLGW